MPSRYLKGVLPAVAAALLLLARDCPAEHYSVVGDPMYTIRYLWLHYEFTLLDTVESDTVWTTRAGDSDVVQMKFFRFALPTPPDDCTEWGVGAWTVRLSQAETTGVLMQIYPQDVGDTSFSYPASFWGQWGTYHACPFGELSLHRSPVASDSHNAWLLAQERPATGTIILGVRTYPWHIHVIDHVVLEWDATVNVDKRPPGPPASFSVAPCYPNPFNASVAVPFTLAAPRHVSVIVYSILGRRVATLLDGQLPAGTREVRWAPADIGSGVFLVEVSSANHTAVQRVAYVR